MKHSSCKNSKKIYEYVEIKYKYKNQNIIFNAAWRLYYVNIVKQIIFLFFLFGRQVFSSLLGTTWKLHYVGRRLELSSRYFFFLFFFFFLYVPSKRPKYNNHEPYRFCSHNTSLSRTVITGLQTLRVCTAHRMPAN